MKLGFFLTEKSPDRQGPQKSLVSLGFGNQIITLLSDPFDLLGYFCLYYSLELEQ